MTITLLPRTDDLNFERNGLRFVRLTETRWRIVQRSGAVVGYLDERSPHTWVISRMTADRRGFVCLGEFGSRDEATDALRWM